MTGASSRPAVRATALVCRELGSWLSVLTPGSAVFQAARARETTLQTSDPACARPGLVATGT